MKVTIITLFRDIDHIVREKSGSSGWIDEQCRLAMAHRVLGRGQRFREVVVKKQ